MGRTLSLEGFLTATPLDELLRLTLKGDLWSRGLVAFRQIETYVRGAEIQQQRIERASRRVDAHFERTGALFQRRSSANPIADMSREIHYYFICWNSVRQHLLVLRNATGSRTLKLTLRVHQTTFAAYRAMRDHLEHFDDRPSTGRFEGCVEARKRLCATRQILEISQGASTPLVETL